MEERENRTHGIQALVLLGLGACGATLYAIRKHIEPAQGVTGKTIGSGSDLGGSFTLVDTNGRVVTDRDLRGTYSLMYFGFSRCPDICPDEMIKATKVITELDKMRRIGPVVRPVFITIDPFRDTVGVIREYIKDYHPRYIGLTGTPQQIAEYTKKCRVYFTLPDLANEDEDYLVDHSIILYFMDKEGRFVDFFGKNHTAEEITAKIAKHIRGKA